MARLLLHVAVSPRSDASVSRRAAAAMIAALRAASPDLAVVERDLAMAPVPHPDESFVTASLMPASDRGEAEHQVLALSEALIAEIDAADMILISTPMHNFTVPSVLKAWLDQVVRPGRTFRTSPTGKIGLLADRPVLVVVACGGRFGDGLGAQTDFLEPYLRYVLGTIGLANVNLLRLQGLLRDPLEAAAALETAHGWIGRQIASPRPPHRSKAG